MSTPQPQVPRDRRTWSDDELVAAVASERSWRGVARALGLRPTSTVTIRRHADRLHLDTTHFTGQRPWSDSALRRAVAEASTWSEVLRLLDVANNGDALARVRGRAVRLGLERGHLDPAPDPVHPSEVAALAPRPGLLRAAATSIAMAWFGLRGLTPAVPAEPREYDLLVAFPSAIRRVQVKSSTCRTSHGRWQVSIGHRPYALDRSAGRCPYQPGTLDYFFIVVGDGALYLVPARVLAGRISVLIDSYPDYRAGDASSLLE